MIGCTSVLQAIFNCVHRSIRISLQPQSPRKKGACPHPQINLKAIGERSTVDGGGISDDALNMALGRELIAQSSSKRTAS